MTHLISEHMAVDFAYDGIMNTADLKEDDLHKWVIQLFDEEATVGEQLEMLFESDLFQRVPRLIISSFRTKDPSPGSHLRNELINRMIQESFQQELLKTCMDALLQTYAPQMESMLEEAHMYIAESTLANQADAEYVAQKEAML